MNTFFFFLPFHLDYVFNFSRRKPVPLHVKHITQLLKIETTHTLSSSWFYRKSPEDEGGGGGEVHTYREH